ncbi:MAG: TetR/AcrR family transcriptional regulator [Sedimentisphaerales bacterium]|nr:TetR/AcrR family transcriptional regulator [Sedimentisphaerales bacterium]
MKVKAMTPRCEQIVDVAIKLLSGGGISALTIKNLAEAVGVTEPALYRHFKCKMDILVAILNRLEANIYSLFSQNLNSENSILDQIQMIYTSVFHNFAAQPAMASVVFSEEMFRHDPRLSEHVSRIMDTVQNHILRLLRSKKGRAECRQDVPAKDLARVIMGSLRFVVTRWRLSGYAFDLEKEGAALCKSLRLMIAAASE